MGFTSSIITVIDRERLVNSGIYTAQFNLSTSTTFTLAITFNIDIWQLTFIIEISLFYRLNVHPSLELYHFRFIILMSGIAGYTNL